MTLKGVDSAFGPSLASVTAAQADGVVWWGCYVGGPGAYHAWTVDEVAVLKGRVAPLPIWVPTYGMTEDALLAGRAAHDACRQRGIVGGGLVLDTEIQSINNATLHPFVDMWCATVGALGWLPIVYRGARYGRRFVWDPLWGQNVQPDHGDAVQYGPADRYGMSVDVNLADVAFPLATFTTPAPPPPQPVPVPVPVPPTPVGDKMLHTVTMPTDGDGNGWVQTAIAWPTFQAATLIGSDPGVDGVYWKGDVHVQDRNNAVLVSVTNFLANSTATAYVLTSG